MYILENATRPAKRIQNHFKSGNSLSNIATPAKAAAACQLGKLVFHPGKTNATPRFIASNGLVLPTIIFNNNVIIPDIKKLAHNGIIHSLFLVSHKKKLVMT